MDSQSNPAGAGPLDGLGRPGSEAIERLMWHVSVAGIDYYKGGLPWPEATERLREELQAELDAAVAAERDRLALACWEHRGHFASDGAARAFAELVRSGKA